ncbi:hypothetical protein PC116_g26452 [Phytophthora cactorum]|nr:hypothetical protein PC116_g26452 [Phytophthora cactorum]
MATISSLKITEFDGKLKTHYVEITERSPIYRELQLPCWNVYRR